MVRKNKNETIWVLIYSKPQEEIIAEKNLNQQGFKTFLPMILPTNNTKSVQSPVPIFPRYLFAQIDLNLGNWNVIKSTYGVNKIVMFSEKFTSIPDTIVKSIQERLGDSGIYREEVSLIDYQKGDKVLIKEGKFEGIDAIFLSKKSKDRVRLLLKLLNSSVVAEISELNIGHKEKIKAFKF